MAAKVPKLIQDEYDLLVYRIPTNEILLPLYVLITKKLTVGAEVRVCGGVTSNADTFSINLMKDECSLERFPESGVLLHFNPRLNKKVVVRNSAVNGKWEKEETKSDYFPFSKGEDFQVDIRMQTLGYKAIPLAIDGSQCSLAEYIHIAGDVRINSIEVRYPSLSILVDNEPFCDFVRKETQCSLAEYIHIAGDVRINSIEVRYPSLSEAPPEAVTCMYAQGQSGKSSGSASLAYIHMDAK